MQLVTHRVPGLVLTDHAFEVPLDYARPNAERITVFAREAVAAGKKADQLPWLVFLQGGPGFGAPRPVDVTTGWIKRAAKEYRLLLLDQRGTGRSTPVGFQSLARLSSPQAQAAYLRHFRADNIVRDAEWIRKDLEVDQWSVLGQSYGGFCVVHYLSAAPAGLREALIMGGLPPINHHADDVYRATYPHVIA